MYALMGLRWQTVGDIAAFARGSVGESALRAPRGWNLAGVIVGKAIFVTWAIAIPLLVYPWWAVLGAYIGLHDGHEPDHGDDVPARPLRRGGIVRIRRAKCVPRGRRGPYTRSRRRSTSALATRC